MAAHRSDEDIQSNFDVPNAAPRKVRILEGQEVTLDQSLWEDSAVLRNLPQNGAVVHTVDMSIHTFNLLLQAHREKVIPLCVLDTYYDLLKATTELQLENLRRLSLKHLFRSPDFWRFNYPEDLPDAIVLTCFEESLKRLFRTKAIYVNAMWEVVKLGRGDDIKESLFRTFRSKYEEFGDLGLEPVPIVFSQRSVPIVITKMGSGEYISTICQHGKCFPFEVFGTNFDLYEAQVDAFYLKYATYVLYKSGDAVYYKDLRNRTEAQNVLEKCTLFISKEDDVFVVTEETLEHRIWKWIENDNDGGNFAVIHRGPEEIAKLDFDPDTRILLILKYNGSLSLRRVGERKLILLRRIHGTFHSAWFHQCRVFTLHFDSETLDESETRRLRLCRMPLSSIESYPVTDEDSDEDTEEDSVGSIDEELVVETNRKLRKFVVDGRIISSGGNLFKLSHHGLEMYDSIVNPLLVGRTGYVAMSELCLFP